MDRTLLLWVVAHRSPWVTASARALMALGTATVPAVAAALAVLILAAICRGWRLLAVAALAAVVAGALSVAAKVLVHRPRPPAALSLVAAHGSSMPSTDAALTAAAGTVLIVAVLRSGLRARRVLAVVAAAGVAVVGAALVYLGAHWTSDVLVGWVLGTGTAAALNPLVGRRGAQTAPR